MLCQSHTKRNLFRILRGSDLVVEEDDSFFLVFVISIKERLRGEGKMDIVYGWEKERNKPITELRYSKTILKSYGL